MKCKRGSGRRLNDSQRLEVVLKLQKRLAPSKRAIARDYNVSESAIRKLWNQRDEILSRTETVQEATKASTFRIRQPHFPELEERLYRWIEGMRRLELPIPPSLVMAKAAELAQAMDITQGQFKASWGWLASFRSRKGLKASLLYGEGAEVNKEDPDLLNALDALYNVIKQYPPACIYNMDETGLFFRLLPRYTLLMRNKDMKSVRGKKRAKDRVTLVVRTNADGSNKIPCAMIGKSKTLACSVGREWRIAYFEQKHAWMD